MNTDIFLCSLSVSNFCYHQFSRFKTKMNRGNEHLASIVSNLRFKSRGVSKIYQNQEFSNITINAGWSRMKNTCSLLECDIDIYHDDVIKWKYFPRYWPFVRIIHWSPVNFPHKGQWRGALMFSLICTLNKRLSKQSWGGWFGTPSRPLWRHCNVLFIK